MGSFSANLKSEREKRKISLAQIAADTNISLRHLESLEEGRFHDLPGGMYNRAFIKAYCESLDLDLDEVMDRYEAEISATPEKPARSRGTVPQKDSSLKLSPVVVWSALLLIAAIGVFNFRSISSFLTPYFSQTRFEEPRYSESQPPAPSMPSPSPAPAPMAPEPETAPPAVEPITPQPETPAHVAPPQEAQPPTPPTPVAPSVPAPTIQLRITATDKCWVSVGRDGSAAVSRLLEPGEVQSIGATERISVLLGNAGGASLTINGRPAKPLGKAGEVVKITIDKDSLQNLVE